MFADTVIPAQGPICKVVAHVQDEVLVSRHRGSLMFFFCRRQVMSHHGVGCHAVIVAKPGAIKKTTSGKVQRRACRAAFMSGEYSEVLFLPSVYLNEQRDPFIPSAVQPKSKRHL